MAKIKYNSVNADYVKLKFKCQCGKELVTETIPVKEKYEDKEINDFVYCEPIVCNDCKTKYALHFHDDSYSAYFEIPELTDDGDIMYIHEIPYENSKKHDSVLCNYIIGITDIKDFVEGVNNQDVIQKNLLYRMAFSYLISIMDAFLHNTFIYNITKYEVFYNNFISCSNEFTRINSKERIVSVLKSKSFQNLEYVVIPYYKRAFKIDIPDNKKIQKATQIRNAIIHNNCRDEDGYEYQITKSYVMELLEEVKQIVKTVNSKIEDAIIEEVILPNLNLK